MNINNLKFLQVKSNNIQQNNQTKYYLTNSTADTFEDFSKVSFKGSTTKIVQATAKTLQESAKEIMGNSDMLAKFGAFAAAAFAGLTALASGKRDESTEVAETLVNAFNKIEENNETNQKISSDTEDDNIRVLSPEYKEVREVSKEEIINIPQKEENVNLVKVGFPKKHGRFSHEQTKLKNIVENYELPQESADKLFELCEVVIKSKDNTFEKYGFDTAYLIEQLPLHSETVKDSEEFVNKLYEQYKNSDIKVETENIETITIETDTEKEEIFKTESEQETLSGVKIVGKVDITGYKSAKQKFEEKTALAEAKAKETVIKDVTTEKTETLEHQKRQRINKENNIEIETSIDSIDSKNTSYNFRMPGTLNSVYAKTYLTKVMKNFEDTFEEKFYPSIVEKMVENGAKIEDIPKHPKWLTSKPIPKTDLDNFIRKEITERNKDVSPYNNITIEDADYLADLIEFEPRFKKYFTLHAALRFIDRVVDFESDEDPSVQIEQNLDVFFNAITKALGQNVKIDSYSQKDTKDDSKIYYGTRMILEPDEKNNPELFAFAGSFPLIIGLSENQPRSDFYDYKYKTPLIHTIFFQGL